MKITKWNWTGTLFGLVFALFFSLSLRQLSDYDVWFQLLAGQETIRTGAVPHTEFYIYSALGEPSIFVGWLWGGVLYLAWVVGGYSFMSFFNSLVWASVFTIAAAAMLKKIALEHSDLQISPKAQIATVLIGLSIAYQYLVGRAVFRAEVTLYLAWVTALYLSAGIDSDTHRLRRFLIAVPFLSWALGWFHTTSIFMVLLLTAFFFQAAAAAIDARGLSTFLKARSSPWLLSLVATVLLPCINPNGVQQAIPLIWNLSDVTIQIINVTQTGFKPDVGHVTFEYRRLIDVPRVWPTAILFFISSVLVICLQRKNRIANALFLTVGLLLSLLHIRALALWAIFLIVPLGVAFAPWLQNASAVLLAKGRGALLNVLIVMCCVWTIGVAYNRAGSSWGMGYLPDSADQRLLQSIRQALPQGGLIFNWHPLGAYLRWHLGPAYLVSMDGHFVDMQSAAWKAYFGIEDDPKQGLLLIDKWNVGAVYHPVVVPTYGEIHWLPHALMNQHNWRLAAIDSNGVAFVRTDDKLDADTKNRLMLEYWRRVVSEATAVALVSGGDSDRKRANATIRRAAIQIERLKSLIN